jgi:hypothetical protein
MRAEIFSFDQFSSIDKVRPRDKEERHVSKDFYHIAGPGQSDVRFGGARG